MRVAFGIALLLGACTTANPAFDGDDVESADEGIDARDTEPAEEACTPADALELVTFDFEHIDCSGHVELRGMLVTQDEGAFTMVPCEDECPCEPEALALGITLHPDIPIPVFSECLVVRAELDDEDCTPTAVTIRGIDERMLVHAEGLDSAQSDAGLEVSRSLMESCDCEACDEDSPAPGTYALGFASETDEVGPLRAGEMAEMTMSDDDGDATWVVKALSTAIDCGCESRRTLQWSVTRG